MLPAYIEYNEIVPKGYSLNPATDDLIYSDELENEQIVLVDVPGREDDKDLSTTNIFQLLSRNRWCIVTKIRKEAINGQTLVRFIGVYSDGNKEIRSAVSDRGWFVKRTPTTLSEVTEEVIAANKAALLNQ